MAVQEIELTQSNFQEESQTGIMLVDFWAAWCAPCRMQSPIVDRLAEKLGDRIKVAKCNVDDQQDLAVQFRVRSIPTLVVLKDGREVERMVGLQSEDELVSRLEQHLI